MVILFACLIVFAGIFVIHWVGALKRNEKRIVPSILSVCVGFVTCFFDTLGIGSFAPTTAIFRMRKAVVDEHIPGTLNVGHTIPTILQAFIFIAAVPVAEKTLVVLIVAAMIGAWLGAGFVSQCSRRTIQLSLGSALLVAAGLLMAKIYNWFPPGGDSISLTGYVLLVAAFLNVLFGALMTIGVGAYAPIMIMVSLLGMNPKAAFPIMMGSCAFLMTIASTRIVRNGMFDPPAAIGLTVGGMPAVVLASILIKELSIEAVRWIVVIVVIYTSQRMLRDACSAPTTAGESEIGTKQPK